MLHQQILPHGLLPERPRHPDGNQMAIELHTINSIVNPLLRNTNDLAPKHTGQLGTNLVRREGHGAGRLLQVFLCGVGRDSLLCSPDRALIIIEAFQIGRMQGPMRNKQIAQLLHVPPRVDRETGERELMPTQTGIMEIRPGTFPGLFDLCAAQEL